MDNKKDIKSNILIKSSRILPDDIECVEWLSEIGMEQYIETFLANFTYGGKYLSRKRLEQVRIQDFPKMNITNYEHQKILLEHIKLTLKHEYSNIERRRMSQILSPMKAESKETNNRIGNNNNNDNGKNDNKNNNLQSKALDFKKEFEKSESQSNERRNSKDKSLKKQDSVNTSESIEQRKKAQRAVVKKRNSFDDKVWESIHKYRGTPKEKEETQAEPKQVKKGPRRRSTFDGLPDQLMNDDATKGKIYGNMALQFNLLQTKMLQIQEQHLQNIRQTIGCDIVNILFFNDHSRELMMCINERWFRVPSESGVSGWCVLTGETVNIADAYLDHRFNENVDKVTGYKTKTMLCTPVRANRGGGRIIGVIELINKHNGELFTSNDEDVLAQMVYQFTDDLSAEFTQLLEINHSIASFATPILPSDGMLSRVNGGVAKSYQGPTAATANYRNLVTSTKKYLEERVDSSDPSGFRLGNVDQSQWEGENRRRERRRSFGEKLNNEIENNPELLHVRKEK